MRNKLKWLNSRAFRLDFSLGTEIIFPLRKLLFSHPHERERVHCSDVKNASFCFSQANWKHQFRRICWKGNSKLWFTCDKQEKNSLVSWFLYFTQAHSIISFGNFKGKIENWGNSNEIWSGECENSSAARVALWKREKKLYLCATCDARLKKINVF